MVLLESVGWDSQTALPRVDREECFRIQAEYTVSPLDRDLIVLGLTPKEAAVYLALLELGTASVQAIARRAELVRPTTYVILEHLTRKGLVSKASGADAKKMLFSAEDPSHLERYLDDQVREIDRRRSQLGDLIPELKSAYASGEEKPRVRLFEGKDGLRGLQEEFIEAGQGPVVGVVSADDLYALFPEDEFHQKIRSIRLQAGLRSRQVYTTARQRPSLEEDRVYLRENRFMPPEKLPLHGSLAANGPVLSIVSFRSKIIGVLIEHKDIADSFRAIFELIWEAAERYQQGNPLTAPKQTVW